MYLVFFIVYLLVVGYLAGGLIERWFGLSRLLAWFAGVVTTLYALSFLGGIFLVLWTYKAWEVPVVAGVWFVIVVSLSFFNPPPNLPLGARGRKFLPSATSRPAIGEPPPERGEGALRNGSNSPQPSLNLREGGYVVVVIWCLLAVTWLAMLWSGRSGELQLSPWGSLPSMGIYVFFLLTLLTAGLLFTRLSWGWLISLIIVHSLLLHAYLPVVYEKGFGGDRWRHLAAERWLQDGKVYSPALFGEVPLRWSTLGPLKIPTVFVVGNKTSYAAQWFWSLMWQEVSGVDALLVEIWFFPVLWSLVMPLLLYGFSGLLFRERTPRLLAALAGSLFYPLQVYGALTLPTGFSFIPFVIGVYAWLKWSETKERCWRNLALGLTAALSVGYVLYFILLVTLGLVLECVRRCPRHKFWLFFGAAVILPLAEVVQGTSQVSLEQARRVPATALEAFLRLTALKGTVPLTGFLDQGNFLYNQTLMSIIHVAFLPRGLTLVVTGIVWVLALIGLWQLVRERGRAKAWLAWAGLVLLLNFFISWVMLSGVHVLARRLDLAIAVWLALMAMVGTWHILQLLVRRQALVGAIAMVGVGLAYGMTSTYASGPRLQTVSTDEFNAMNYVIGQEQSHTAFMSHPCVLGDTWPLLALEAESRRQIVAGGFPLYDPDYAQPERVQLFNAMNRFPSVRYLEKALNLTDAPYCYFITEPRFLWGTDKDLGQKQMWQALGKPLTSFGEVWVWKYGK